MVVRCRHIQHICAHFMPLLEIIMKLDTVGNYVLEYSTGAGL